MKMMVISLIIVILAITLYWWRLEDLREIISVDFSRIKTEEIKVEDKIFQTSEVISLSKKDFLEREYQTVKIIPKVNFPNNIEIIFFGQQGNQWYKTEEKIPLRTFQVVSSIEDHGSVLLIWLDKSIIPLLAILISVLGVFIIAFGLSFFQSRL
jgi:hypothetical protein